MGQDLLCVGLTTLDVLARPIDALPAAGRTALASAIDDAATEQFMREAPLRALAA